MNKIYLLFTKPKVFIVKILRHLLAFLPDEQYLKLFYRLLMHKKLDLDNPQTFTEKIQWLKLYYRKPIYTTMVCKYEVKEYIKNKIGEEYIIPTLGVWDCVEDIDWESLPNQFVLKCTHDSGGLVICKDKNKLDICSAKKKLRKCLTTNYYLTSKEWPYKNVKRKIIAEKYMMESGPQKEDSDLADYKFYCFDGEPTYCQVIRDRRTKETIDFYDMEWNHMPFVGLNPVADTGDTPVVRPINLDIMIKVCRKLSKDLPFVRIDLYVINNIIYFGEITFFPASGFGTFTPIGWNEKLGNLIKLPQK